jgi:hypothetical protein
MRAVRTTILDAVRIWLALAMVLVLMWLLVAALTAIQQAFSPSSVQSHGRVSGIFMPPLWDRGRVNLEFISSDAHIRGTGRTIR